MWGNGDGSGRYSFGPSSGWARTHQVEDLHHVEQKGDAGHHEHEDDEDGLLRGPRHVALHSEGARGSGADDPRVHDEPVKIILPHDERYLQNDSKEDGGHVGSQQVAFNLDVAIFVRVLWSFDGSTRRVALHMLSQLILFVDNMEDMAQVE